MMSSRYVVCGNAPGSVQYNSIRGECAITSGLGLGARAQGKELRVLPRNFMPSSVSDESIVEFVVGSFV